MSLNSLRERVAAEAASNARATASGTRRPVATTEAETPPAAAAPAPAPAATPTEPAAAPPAKDHGDLVAEAYEKNFPSKGSEASGGIPSTPYLFPTHFPPAEPAPAPNGDTK